MNIGGAIRGFGALSPTVVIEDVHDETMIAPCQRGCALLVRNCSKCNITVDSQPPIMKLMVEHCTEINIEVRGRLLTSTVEMWGCPQASITLSTDAAMQLDLCDSVSVTFKEPSQLIQIVWAGIDRLDVRVELGDMHWQSGLQRVCKASCADIHRNDDDEHDEDDPPVDEKLTQFIVRVVDGALLEERLIRLPNGFPTTEREKLVFEEKEKRTVAALERTAKEILDEAGFVGNNDAQATAGRPKPNAKCYCGSEKRYKHCCMISN